MKATPNPMSQVFTGLKFLPNGQSVDFPNVSHAYKSPLAKRIFDLSKDVRCILITDDYITVTLDDTTTADPSAAWQSLGAQVTSCLESFAAENGTIETSDGIVKGVLWNGDPKDGDSQENESKVNDVWCNDTDFLPSDTEVVLAIKELIATRIRPMLQSDGGNIRFVGFEAEEGIVFVLLQGACVSCPSSTSTLKFGVERMLKHWIPEVAVVEEVDEDFALEYRRTREELLKEQLLAREAAKEKHLSSGKIAAQPVEESAKNL